MSVDFNGSDEHALLNNSAALSPAAGNFTVCAWVNMDSVDANSQNIFHIYGDGNADRVHVGYTGGTTSFITTYRDVGADTAQVVGSIVPDAGTWYHVAGVLDGTTARLYVNGVADGTDVEAALGDIDTSDGPVPSIGVIWDGADLSQFFDGKIEDLECFNRALTVEEISARAAGYRGPLGGEVGRWSLNEATGAAGAWEGTSLANGTNLFPDLSVNDNTGDPVNTPTGRASEAPRYGVAV